MRRVVADSGCAVHRLVQGPQLTRHSNGPGEHASVAVPEDYRVAEFDADRQLRYGFLERAFLELRANEHRHVRAITRRGVRTLTREPGHSQATPVGTHPFLGLSVEEHLDADHDRQSL